MERLPVIRENSGTAPRDSSGSALKGRNSAPFPGFSHRLAKRADAFRNRQTGVHAFQFNCIVQIIELRTSYGNRQNE